MEISVLMSVYNETEEEIIKSISSILNQSFTDFELIIVIDNPELSFVENLIVSFQDKRIICLKNERNIGLALSMNKASEIAKGKYIARMDADDISDLNRLKKEYEYLESHPDIGLLCSNYHYIDEDDNYVDFKYQKISFNNYYKLLPHINVIHHPTVMMRKEIFDAVGGYRNFPCTQDYDLWLRLYFENVKFARLEDDLLAYRIRENSTWKSNGMRQQVIYFYIKELYKERKKTGNDSYSIENLRLYLTNNGVTEQGIESYQKGKNLILESKENLRNKKIFRCIKNFYSGMRKNKFLRKEIKNKLIIYSILKVAR